MNLRKITATLHPSDIVIIGFYIFLSIVNVAFASRIPLWWVLVLVNVAVIGFLVALGSAEQKTGWRVLTWIHDWHVAPTVFFTFKELYFMIKPIHGGVDYDDWLIAADRFLFGVDPGRWLMQFAQPWLTEILQLSYTLFYLLFIIIGIELYRKRANDLFHYFMFVAVYGFFLSYVGYFFLPAVGPRFTLFDFPSLDRDLPGLFLTEPLRWFVNYGGSVPMGVSNAVAMAGTQRDVFPSGHTMMTLVLMYLSLRYKLAVRWYIFVTGFLLIIGTVYLRYHYVIDLIGGAFFMLFCLLTAPRVYAFITRTIGTRDHDLA
jgi:membrane-associated phospholipid phosphatase